MVDLCDKDQALRPGSRCTSRLQGPQSWEQLFESVQRSRMIASATTALIGAGCPGEVCEVLEGCVEQYWGGAVAAEICLKPDVAPAPLDDFGPFADSEVLLCRSVGRSQLGSTGRSDLRRRLPHGQWAWFGDDVQTRAWWVRELHEHDAKRLCLELGMGLTDSRSGAADGRWKFVETSRAPEGSAEAHLLVPLRARHGCIGVLHLSSAKPEEFADTEKQEAFGPLVDAVAMQLSALRSQHELDCKHRQQEALASDYRAMLESMFPPHVVDELSKARSPVASGTPCTMDELPDIGFTRGISECSTASDWSPARKLRQTSGEVMERLEQLPYAEYHDSVAILFTDIKGFTNLSERLEPEDIVVLLDELYRRFDDIIDAHSPLAYKVETIGDSYMVAFGLFEEEPDSARAAATAVRVAAKLIQAASGVTAVTKDGASMQVQLRAGISLGQIMSGIVGKKMPRYCMFGDTVNTGSRMESTGAPGMIHTTAAVRDACSEHPEGAGMVFHDTGGREVKGKGLMKTYLVEPGQVLAVA